MPNTFSLWRWNEEVRFKEAFVSLVEAVDVCERVQELGDDLHSSLQQLNLHAYITLFKYACRFVKRLPASSFHKRVCWIGTK